MKTVIYRQINRSTIFFQFFRRVSQHILYRHETNKPWKCDQCDFAHAVKHGLQGHIRTTHKKESDIKEVCHLCGWKTHSKNNLRVHIRCKHENIKRFSCNVCDHQFYHNKDLKVHIRGMLTTLL